MLRIALVFGAIAGFVVIGVMSMLTAVFGLEDLTTSQAVGYLVMVLGLSLIFVGVKRHRDQALGGVIKFWPAFGLGLAIAAVAGIAYAIGWEIFLAVTGSDFIGSYIDSYIASREAAGVSGQELQAEIARMEAMRAQYRNPLFRLPITFSEIFPVGALIALISAAILRDPKMLPKRA